MKSQNMPKQYVISVNERNVLAILLLIAVGASALLTSDAHFWPSLLLNSFYFLTLALGGLVFVAIQHVSNAGWSTAIRRVPEAMTKYLPIGAMTLMAVFFGRHSLYQWTHPETVQSNPTLHAKAGYLSTPFFFTRMFVLLAIWLMFAFLINRESRLQDSGDSLIHTARSKKISGVFLALFAITFSLASFDWLMSLEPEFYSTIFAFYIIAGLLLSGFAAITIFVILLRRRGFLPRINEEHFHSLGKLIFAFSTFWAYIWLSQYLLIYYTNMPEEIVHYLRQTATPGWKLLFIINLFLNWVIPFVMLISHNTKRREATLLTASAIVLIGHWVDLHLTIFPVFGWPVSFNVIDIVLPFGFVSVFLLSFVNGIEKTSLMPLNDPYLEESLALHPVQTNSRKTGWDREAKRALAFSTVAFAITFSVWGLISALAPKFAAIYHLSAMQKSVLIAVPVLLGSIGRLPAGILADKFGGRIVFGSLLLFCLVPCTLISLSNSYMSLVGWGLLLGIAGTSFSVGIAFTSKWFSANQQGTALGIYGMGNIGQSIAMFSSPVLVQATNNWRVPFWVFGGIAAVFGVVFLLFARNSKVSTKPKTMREYVGILGKEPRAWGLSLLYFLTFGCFVALSIYLPTLLVETFGLSLIDAGSRVAGFVIVATMARPLGGWLADRYGGARILLFVFGILSAVVLCLTSNNMAVFTFGALGAASLVGVGNGAVFKLVPDYFPRETGTVTGLVGAAGGIGGFLPTLLLGFIKSQTGSYAIGFVFLSCFALLCLTVNYVFFVHRSQEASESWTTV